MPMIWTNSSRRKNEHPYIHTYNDWFI